MKFYRNRADILDKALPVQKQEPHEYSTYRDGSYRKENVFDIEEHKISAVCKVLSV